MDRQRRRRSNPLTIMILAVLVAGAVYVNSVVVPQTQPLFIPTPTATIAPEVYVTQAEGLANEGMLIQSIQAYQQALQSDPKNGSIYLAMAKLQLYTNDYTGAIDSTGLALVINPNNSAALALRGYAEALNGDSLGGEADIVAAKDMDPNNPVPYAYQAEVLALRSASDTGNLEALTQAREVIKEALRLGPDLLETHRAYGVVLEMTSNYNEAVDEFQKAIAINPYIADLHIYLGRNYRVMDPPDYSSAIREFTQATTLNPTDPDAYNYLARTYTTQGDYAHAIQYGLEAIKYGPTDPYLYGNLGSVYYRQKDYPRAVQMLGYVVHGGVAEGGETVEGLPLDYWPISEYYYFYGLAQARLGQCTEALEIAQAVSLNVSIEDVAVANAQEIVSICQQVASGQIATVNATPEGDTAAGDATTEETPTPEALAETATETPAQ